MQQAAVGQPHPGPTPIAVRSRLSLLRSQLPYSCLTAVLQLPDLSTPQAETQILAGLAAAELRLGGQVDASLMEDAGLDLPCLSGICRLNIL
eukprot:SAG22_NODE_1064_length_5756_cov_48.259502_9_plen_92_part_00